MATAREIHRHMKSVKNIGQITKAMKMVAAARLRRAQERAAASRPYAIKIKEVLSNIVGDKGTLSGLNPRKHPLIQKRPVKKIGFLVMCSDKGLAGAYGSNVLKHAMGEILKVKGEVVIITCGRRARDFFRHRGFNVIQAHFGFSDKPSYNNAVEVAYDAAQRFADEQFDELRIVYTLFKSAPMKLFFRWNPRQMKHPKAAKHRLKQIPSICSCLKQKKFWQIWHLVIWKLLFMPHSYSPQRANSVPV